VASSQHGVLGSSFETDYDVTLTSTAIDLHGSVTTADGEGEADNPSETSQAAVCAVPQRGSGALARSMTRVLMQQLQVQVV